MYYDALFVDVYNSFYRVHYYKKSLKLMKISLKTIYQDSFKEFVKLIKNLSTQYLRENGRVFFLFDNHFIREDLLTAHVDVSDINRKKLNSNYKANRIENTKYFYNTLDFIKYYYSISEDFNIILKIPKVEADDLVEPCLNYCGEMSKNLMVTNDLDWARYLDTQTHWLNDFNKPPVTPEGFFERYGYYPTKEKIILNKVLFGDHSDNIKTPFTWKKEISNRIFNKYASVQEFVSLEKDLAIKKEIDMKKPEIDSLVKIFSSIPISEETFKSHFVKGRKLEKIRNGIDKFVLSDGEEDFDDNNFKFGGVKVPRNQIN